MRKLKLYHQKKLIIFFFIFGIVCVILICAGKNLVVSDPLEKSDVIVVLSGGDAGRLEEAARLYHDGWSESILLTNTGRLYGELNSPYTQFQKDRLKELKVPEGGIYLAEFEAKNTGQEATGIINKMYEMGCSSAIIVTDSWHTRRTKIIFSDSFGNTGFRVSFHPVPDQTFDTRFWWLSASGWRHTVSEYVRMLGYWIKRETHIPDYPSLPFQRKTATPMTEN